jgi:hypothetical protein
MRKAWLFAIAALTVSLAIAVPALATHSWNGYHWARTANPFTLTVGDNVSAAWDSTLNTTVADWTQSSVLNLTKVTGQARGKCRPTSGRVEVCNGSYGNNGWLGVAQVWASGSHITQGTVKLNDTYFNTPTYNTAAWRNLVSCQEVGHTLGLDHQDENFSNPNLNTCMDYTNSPGSNQHPNAHDYDELVTIYTHLDSTSTVGAAAPKGLAGDADPGLPPGAAPGKSSYVRDLGGGRKLYTFVVWAKH